MIYPTARAVLLIAIGAPIAAVLAALMPGLWAIGIAWAVMLLLLLLLDGLIAARAGSVSLAVPTSVEVGGATTMGVEAEFSGLMKPARVAGNLAVDDRLSDSGRAAFELLKGAGPGSRYQGHIDILPSRRGTGTIGKMWLRWTGPLGLAWRQVTRQNDESISVLPNISAVRSPTVQMFLRDSVFGLLARKFRGEGSEFEALADYQPGMDRRSIDWKGSARHSKLLAKEYDTERNNQIVFALDCGSAMCEPIDGLPRIDRAVSAALLTAYITLKSGDRTSLFSFAAKPELSTPFLSGSRSFHRLQREAATIDYRHQESNFTLALSSLSNRLKRRSLIIIFTDFTDPTSADLMLEAAGRLIDKHLVLFVVLEDEELAHFTTKAPETAGDVARAVTAQSLLDQKKMVITRLQHMGIDVIEGAHEDIGTRLINGYLKIKRRGQL
ncbi:Uncharacterized conserved protein, DUF58 family, contains vWF domain [Parasphingorhabdus marina DSM 22363]|uniref:Uncharacterized conserved protein, DUF58 family, contains vWF domain n=1 Tax=Parasphingorhabdus marina DSM 22363 TaxID=1123272 RepID=A0A1N6CMH6_9SPHN|nr:DUF58 domain-containing protein [Parasphingorhabdus marina]SIN59808.1 Uncharacterized conserved protein, DUF58 family, contains vWF domain [Parasphingorhabdus marina DSM 22363]